MSADVSRATEVRSGVRIEVFTVIWMVIEAVVSIGAGIIAGSALLTAFGLDSVIELVSGAILLRRLLIEAGEGDTERVERAEHRAALIVAISLALLVFLCSWDSYLWPGNSFDAGEFSCWDWYLYCCGDRDALVSHHKTTHCETD